MAEGRDDAEIFWVDPQQRGILPLDTFHISRSLARFMRQSPYQVRFDHDFAAVVRGCADRPETWINSVIFDLYQQLFERGQAHSVELWHENTQVGGVYGVSIGGAFFGESMYSRAVNASKIGLAYLTDRLRLGGYRLFDTQFLTDHLSRLGAVEISREEYQQRLSQALDTNAYFGDPGNVPAVQEVLQRNTQTS